MTRNAILGESVRQLTVIAVGQAGRAVANSMQASGLHHAYENDPMDLASQLVSDVRHAEATPAILILADCQAAAQVLDVINAVRNIDSRQRPRVWPAFIAGDIRELADFDARLDELGSGATDVALLLPRATTPTQAARCLDAWLRVKLPAPASVLGDLPDSAGRTCRYVALGAQHVPAPQNESAALPTIDVSHISDRVFLSLTAAVDEESVVRLAHDACNALCAAADHFDVPALIQSEQSFAEALANVRHGLSAALERRITDAIVAAREPHDAADESATDSMGKEEPEDATDVDGDRADLVATLIALASKGSLGRMWRRNQLALAGERVSKAARRDLRATIDHTVEQGQDSLQAAVASALAEYQREVVNAEQVRQQLAVAERAASWRDELEQTAKNTAVWATIDASAVQRSWGGGLPPARHYFICDDSTTMELTDGDGVPAIIDLRDGQTSDVPAATTVLVAQYGLPLSAVR